jgi:hypothetical protein
MKGILLLILIGLLSVVSLGNPTTKQQPQIKVEYSNVFVERWVLIQQVRDRLYAKTQGEKQEEKKQRSENLPDAEQASYPAQIQRRFKRAREHHLASYRTSRVLAFPIRAKNTRRSYHAAYAGAPYQRKMFDTANGALPHGECL